MLDSLQQEKELLTNIRAHLPELAEILKKINSHWIYEDLADEHFRIK
jgi:hypothetical protein